MTVLDFSEVDKAVAEGKAWRAKEILQGRIDSSPYSPKLYEKYGHVLWQMGDLIEAGKYLFISGNRHPEYSEAIQLFLSRWGNGGWHQLKSSFPRKIRQLPLSSFPEQLQNELIILGFQETVVSNDSKTSKFQGLLRWLRKLLA